MMVDVRRLRGGDGDGVGWWVVVERIRGDLASTAPALRVLEVESRPVFFCFFFFFFFVSVLLLLPLLLLPGTLSSVVPRFCLAFGVLRTVTQYLLVSIQLEATVIPTVPADTVVPFSVTRN